eukprot:3100696-Pleurochrysis_carterae.AAC.1
MCRGHRHRPVNLSPHPDNRRRGRGKERESGERERKIFRRSGKRREIEREKEGERERHMMWPHLQLVHVAERMLPRLLVPVGRELPAIDGLLPARVVGSLAAALAASALRSAVGGRFGAAAVLSLGLRRRLRPNLVKEKLAHAERRGMSMKRTIGGRRGVKMGGERCLNGATLCDTRNAHRSERPRRIHVLSPYKLRAMPVPDPVRFMYICIL